MRGPDREDHPHLPVRVLPVPVGRAIPDDPDERAEALDEIEEKEAALAALADSSDDGRAVAWADALMRGLEKPNWWILRLAEMEDDGTTEAARAAVERSIEIEDDVAHLLRARRRCRFYLEMSARDPLANEVFELLTRRLERVLPTVTPAG